MLNILLNDASIVSNFIELQMECLIIIVLEQNGEVLTIKSCHVLTKQDELMKHELNQSHHPQITSQTLFLQLMLTWDIMF